MHFGLVKLAFYVICPRNSLLITRIRQVLWIFRIEKDWLPWKKVNPCTEGWKTGENRLVSAQFYQRNPMIFAAFSAFVAVNDFFSGFKAFSCVNPLWSDFSASSASIEKRMTGKRLEFDKKFITGSRTWYSILVTSLRFWNKVVYDLYLFRDVNFTRAMRLSAGWRFSGIIISAQETMPDDEQRGFSSGGRSKR